MIRPERWTKVLLAGLLAASTCLGSASAAHADDVIERGRYLVKLAGCNDCHTAGYGLKNGAVPESEWLVGDPTGWVGPWGTTYAINIRAYLAALTFEQWEAVVKVKQTRPPMPWYVLREMNREDLFAVYTFIKSLPPNASQTPQALPPGQMPAPPYFQLVLPAAEAAAASGTFTPDWGE